MKGGKNYALDYSSNSFVINGLMLWVVSMFVRGFEIQNFVTAFFAALILTVISSVISFLVKD